MANPEGRLVHGQKHTLLYKKWGYMKTRCYNPNSQNYRFYGGKGIIICEEWRQSFLDFKEWAGNNGYKDGLTIDRINSDENYTPENCQWITMIENIKRSTKPRRKPVRKLNKETSATMCEYESVTEASKMNRIPKSNIFGNLSGTYKSAGGYKWEWILDKETT